MSAKTQASPKETTAAMKSAIKASVADGFCMELKSKNTKSMPMAYPIQSMPKIQNAA